MVVDTVDSGKAWWFIKAVNVFHQYDYTVFTVSPGIYILVTLVFLISLAVERLSARKIKAWYIACAGVLFHLTLLSPLFQVSRVVFVLGILLLAALPTFAASFFLPFPLYLLVFAHALDGAATFITLDIVAPVTGQAYVEQHVLPGLLGHFCGSYLCFYALKVLLAMVAGWLLRNEPKEERFFFASVILVLGLAPGLRDLLRMWCGV